MGLKAFYKNEADIPEAEKSLYVQKDIGEGSAKKSIFILDVDATEGFALENVNGLKTALSRERQNTETLTTKLKAFGDDVDPEVVQEALTHYNNRDKETKQTEATIKDRIKAATEQIVQKHGKELEGYKTKTSTLFNQLQTQLVDNVAMKELSEAKGRVALLMPLIKQRARVREDGEQLIVEVLQPNGKDIAVNSAGSTMSIKELVEELRSSEDYGVAFEGTGQSGTGSSGNHSRQTANRGLGTKDNPIRISSKDQNAINANMDKIANNEAIVVD